MPRGVYQRKEVKEVKPEVKEVVKPVGIGKDLPETTQPVKAGFAKPRMGVDYTYANCERCGHVFTLHYGSEDKWCNGCGCLGFVVKG